MYIKLKQNTKKKNYKIFNNAYFQSISLIKHILYRYNILNYEIFFPTYFLKQYLSLYLY